MTIDVTPSISVLTRVELEGGVYSDPASMSKRRRAVDALLREFMLLDLTSEIAEFYGRIVARSGFSRRKIVDRMIAATALVHDLTLVTLNPRDFQDVPGLRVTSWDAPA